MRILAQALPTTQPTQEVVETDEISRVPIYPSSPEFNKLERMYHSYLYQSSSGEEATLGYGDKLRIIDNLGNLKDVMMMPDGNIGIQDLNLKVEYGAMHTYPTWDDASASLPSQDFDPMGHTASLSRMSACITNLAKSLLTKLHVLIKMAFENDEGTNPYTRNPWR